jgi:hypothetical protein
MSFLNQSISDAYLFGHFFMTQTKHISKNPREVRIKYIPVFFAVFIINPAAILIKPT